MRQLDGVSHLWFLGAQSSIVSVQFHQLGQYQCRLLKFSSSFLSMGRSSSQGGSLLVSSLACSHSKELAELGSQDQAHIELSHCLCPGVQAPLLWQWHWSLRCRSVQISCGTGIWVSGVIQVSWRHNSRVGPVITG